MPRRRGGAAPSRSAPSRPAVAPARPNVAPPQQRPSSTMARPPANAQQQKPPAQAGQSPGLFGQMASTAAGVAVGSSIGHAIGGFFGGGSSQAPEEYQQPDNNAVAQPMDQGMYQSSGNSWDQNQPRVCDTDVKNFTKCMDDNQGNLTICGWYLDQLKACQAAARQY